MSAAEGNLGAILNEVRKDLLDVGLRNPLLNYRPLKSKGLEVVDARPADVYRVLVHEGRQLSFLPFEERPGSQGLQLESSAEQENENSTDDVESEAISEGPCDSGGRYSDAYLQTVLNTTQLQNRLLSTYYAARTSMDEQGVNTLFLALGMLRWQEADSTDETRRAPLILVPVELNRTNVRGRFHLKYSGEDLDENISLRECLKQSFGIPFPDWPDAEQLDVAGYYRAVENAIAGQSRWSIEEDTIVLGFFSFAKFLMYRDLNFSTWPDPVAPLSHELLNNLLLPERTLAGGGSSYGESDFVDDHLKNRKSFHVVDADSTQTLALLDVAAGHNMVIQGPPGTGKSQTIVNLIAEGLAAGKRILFVSEKMAALGVVKRRLDKIGLGPACLELHSNKANKKNVIEEIRRTVEMPEPQVPPRGKLDSAALEKARQALNDYCRAVNQEVRNSGETPHSLYGRFIAIVMRLGAADLPSLELPGDLEWTSIDAQRKRQLVEALQKRVGRCGVPARHPFWGSRMQVYLPMQRDGMRQLLLRAADAV